VFGFGLAATLAALGVFGLVPALRLSRSAPAEVLRSGGRTGTESRGLRRVRSGLVVAQMAVAVVLVAGAGLLLRSFHEIRSVDLGFDDAQVLTFEVHLPGSRFPDGAARERFHDEFQTRLAALPGIDAAGAVSWLPVLGRYHWWSMAVIAGWDGGEVADDTEAVWHDTDARVIAGDYFGAMGITLLRGAAPRDVDMAGEPVAWLNRMAAETVFPDVDPLQQYVFFGGEARRVVGVVEDTPYDARGTVSRKTYVPHAQFADNRNWPLVQTVKARGDLGAVRERLRAELAAVDGGLVLYRARPLSSILAGSRAQDRFATLLMSVFAALALTLAAVGSYGVLAGSVARRRREIGIRLALGAEPKRVRAMILLSALRLSVLGVVAGLAVAWIGSTRLADFLFRVEPTDPGVYLGGGVLLLALAGAAAWLPARRATRVQPVETLAGE
jgi:predicted permease